MSHICREFIQSTDHFYNCVCIVTFSVNVLLDTPYILQIEYADLTRLEQIRTFYVDALDTDNQLINIVSIYERDCIALFTNV